MAYNGATQGDMPVVLGSVMVIVVVVLISTFVIDLLLTVLNPHERTAARAAVRTTPPTAARAAVGTTASAGSRTKRTTA